MAVRKLASTQNKPNQKRFIRLRTMMLVYLLTPHFSFLHRFKNGREEWFASQKRGVNIFTEQLGKYECRGLVLLILSEKIRQLDGNRIVTKPRNCWLLLYSTGYILDNVHGTALGTSSGSTSSFNKPHFSKSLGHSSKSFHRPTAKNSLAV